MGFFSRFRDDSDDDFLGGDFQCRGLTQKGERCKITLESLHCSQTIAQYGFCTKHMAQRHNKAQNPGLFESAHDIYEHDKPHPAIVKAARTGDLVEVKKLLDRNKPDPCNKKKGAAAALVNACRNRKEVEEKYGYDKEWDWDDDTPLIAAAREGHVDVVCELLIRGADTACKSCPSDDVHETAEQAVSKRVAGAKGDVLRELLLIAAQNAAALKPAPPPQTGSGTASAQAALKPPEKKTDLNRLTVEELKTQLRKYKLRVSGKKAELVQRLAGHPVLDDLYAEELRRWEASRESLQQSKSEDDARREKVVAQLRAAAAKLPRTTVSVGATSADAAGRGAGGVSAFGHGARGIPVARGVGAFANGTAAAPASHASSSARSVAPVVRHQPSYGTAPIPASHSVLPSNFFAPVVRQPHQGGTGLSSVSNKRPMAASIGLGGNQSLSLAYPVPDAKRVKTDSLTCSGCMRTFVNNQALSQHLNDSKKCPAAVAQRTTRSVYKAFSSAGLNHAKNHLR